MKTLLIIFLIFVIGYLLISEYEKIRWRKKPLQNFPFTWKGREYWYSRSVAVTGLVFCNDSNNELCVLANKRGSGTPDFNGKWNVPCGYLDFDETTHEAVSREVLEETGIDIPSNEFKFYGFEDSPKSNRQNITFRFTTLLKGNCDDYTFSKEGNEDDEVEEIKWVNIKDIDNYNWAFNHNSLIKEVVAKQFN